MVGAGKGSGVSINGELEYAVGAATSSVAFATAVELASGPSGDCGGGTRPSTCSGFVVTGFKLRTSLFADFSNFDNLYNFDVNCCRRDLVVLGVGDHEPSFIPESFLLSG